jgi:hypothetical protein
MNVADVLSGLDEILLVLNGKYDSVLERKHEVEDNGDDGAEYNYTLMEIESQMERIEQAKDVLMWDVV